LAADERGASLADSLVIRFSKIVGFINTAIFRYSRIKISAHLRGAAAAAISG
jgi:hypothetical protein